MTEWVLILWTMNCGGWHCKKEDNREIPGYQIKAECEESLQGWKSAKPAQLLSHNGVCIKVPNRNPNDP